MDLWHDLMPHRSSPSMQQGHHQLVHDIQGNALLGTHMGKI